MAASDAKPFPLKNTAYRVTFPILDADGDLVTGAAGLDSEVSLDAGTFADCTNEATEIATNSGVYYLDLTSGEMNADTVAVIVKTSTSGAKTTVLVLNPVEDGDIPVNVTAIDDDTAAADNLEAMFDGTGYTGGTTKLEVEVATKTGFSLLRPGGSVISDEGNTSSTFKTDLSSTTDDYCERAWVRFTNGDLINQVSRISAYNGTTKFLAVWDAFTAAPSDGDDFEIINE